MIRSFHCSDRAMALTRERLGCSAARLALGRTSRNSPRRCDSWSGHLRRKQCDADPGGGLLALELSLPLSLSVAANLSISSSISTADSRTITRRRTLVTRSADCCDDGFGHVAV